MNYGQFLENFYRSEKPSELRLGQYFMNELYRANKEMYHMIPWDIDPYYDDKLLNNCIDWIAHRSHLWEAKVDSN